MLAAECGFAVECGGMHEPGMWRNGTNGRNKNNRPSNEQVKKKKKQRKAEKKAQQRFRKIMDGMQRMTQNN